MDAAALVELSRRLLEPSRDEYVAAAAAQIGRLLPAEDICWVQADWDSGSFVVWRASVQARDPAAERILPATYENPAIQTYVRAPLDLSPRRLSDLPLHSESEAAALRASHEYIGAQQLSMVVNVHSATIGHGWVVTRDGRDFRDDELDDASRILPVLYLLDRYHKPNLAIAPADDDLTRRERQVVDLLATGLTAAAIGRLLGISPRTVGKHLENAYRKLGTHDRLLVALGLPVRDGS